MSLQGMQMEKSHLIKKDKSVYIHIPFCDSICTYCDFCKFLKNDEWIYRYLDSLKKEKVCSIYRHGSKFKIYFLIEKNSNKLNIDELFDEKELNYFKDLHFDFYVL